MQKRNSFKYARIDSEIKKTLQVVLHSKLKDYRIKNQINVVDVSVSKDLSFCKVYIQTEDVDKETVIKVLNNSKGFLRTQIANELNLRKTPELYFEYDNTLDNFNRIEELLKKIKE